jgi:uncharacterized membrane protein
MHPINVSSCVVLGDVAYSAKYRDLYADSARSFIGFRTVQDYMGLHNGNEKQLTTDKKT